MLTGLTQATIPRGAQSKEVWRKQIIAQRLVIMLLLNHPEPGIEIPNHQQRRFYKHNPYFNEAWRPLMNRKDAIADRFFRPSWDPRVQQSIRFFSSIYPSPVSLDSRCTFCTRSVDTATSYERLKLYGYTYDDLTYVS